MDRKETRPPAFSAEDARGGEIILRTRTRRIIFIGGLAAAVLLGLVFDVFLRG